MEQSLVAAELLAQGIGILISWNAVLTSLDWFAYMYPGYAVGTWITVCYFVPAMIVQPLNALFGRDCSFTKRINGGYLMTGTVLVLLPLTAQLIPAPLSFLVLCILVFLMGCSNALTQGTLFSLVAMLPGKATSLVMTGNSVAGLLITGLRLVCLLAFDGSLLGSTVIYFTIAALCLVICMWAQVDLMKHSIVQKAMLCTEKELPLLSPGTTLTIDEVGETRWSEVIRLVWQDAVLVWLCYFLTFGMLTHVALATDSSWMSYSYFSTLMLLVFNFFDFCGRLVCRVCTLKASPPSQPLPRWRSS